MGEPYNMRKESVNAYKISVEYAQERGPLGDLDVDETEY
jgi:hypothetical protein